jgi:hypothetical protein
MNGRREACPDCAALATMRASHRRVHTATRKVIRALAKLPPARRAPVLRAVRALLEDA